MNFDISGIFIIKKFLIRSFFLISEELFNKKNEGPDPDLAPLKINQPGDHMTSNNQSDAPIQPWDQSSQVSIHDESSKKIVSDQEVSELSSILGDLKSMALGVQQEMEDQDEKINKLGRTVEEANIRVTDTERRIKNLL